MSSRPVPPKLPPSAKQWQSLPNYAGKKGGPKAMGSLPTPKASTPVHTGAQYRGKEDPLELKQPDSRGHPGHHAMTHEPNLDADYLGPDVNPDSLLADVEALLSQERMLDEQTKWWQERARREAEANRTAEATRKTQDATCKAEVAEIQRKIQSCREEQAREVERRRALDIEVSSVRKEAAEAQHQVEDLRVKLEELASAQPAVEAAKIRAAINNALFAAQATKGRRLSKLSASRSGSAPTSGLNSARTPRDRSASPHSPQPNSARSGGSGAKSPAPKASPRNEKKKQSGMGMGFDDDDELDFMGGGGGGGPPRGQGPGGGGMGGMGGMGFEDDDDDFGAMFG